MIVIKVKVLHDWIAGHAEWQVDNQNDVGGAYPYGAELPTYPPRQKIASYNRVPSCDTQPVYPHGLQCSPDHKNGRAPGAWHYAPYPVGGDATCAIIFRHGTGDDDAVFAELPEEMGFEL